MQVTYQTVNTTCNQQLQNTINNKLEVLVQRNSIPEWVEVYLHQSRNGERSIGLACKIKEHFFFERAIETEFEHAFRNALLRLRMEIDAVYEKDNSFDVNEIDIPRN